MGDEGWGAIAILINKITCPSSSLLELRIGLLSDRLPTNQGYPVFS